MVFSTSRMLNRGRIQKICKTVSVSQRCSRDIKVRDQDAELTRPRREWNVQKRLKTVPGTQ